MLRLTLICSAATSATRRSAFPLDEPIDSAQPPTPLPRPAMAFSSPRLSARQTAALLNVDAAVAPALDDLAVGRWAGRSLRDLDASEPEALAVWRRDPAAAPHGGESLVALRERVEAWLGSLHAARGDILAITHPAVIRSAVLCALSAPNESFWHIDVPPLATVELTGCAGRWNLRVARGAASGQDGAITEKGGPDAEFPP